MLIWTTWDRAGPLGDCSPRLCRLRTDSLALANKYWTYQSRAGDVGPVSLVAWCQQKLVFSPLLLGCSRREAGYEPADRSVGVLWVGSGALLLESSGSALLMTTWNVAIHWPHEIRMVWDHTLTERGMRVAYWLGFPCRVYINSNRCDSRIWVTAYLWPSTGR
jgi:hypothetical protein